MGSKDNCTCGTGRLLVVVGVVDEVALLLQAEMQRQALQGDLRWHVMSEHVEHCADLAGQVPPYWQG